MSSACAGRRTRSLIIGETFYYAGEALAALEVAKQSGLPVVLTIAPMALEKMADGLGIVETSSDSNKPGRTSWA